MYYIPGFNVKSLTNEQIFEQYNELSQKLGYAARFGYSNGYEYLVMLLQILEDERSERLYHENWEQVAPYLTKTIESDGDSMFTKNKQNSKSNAPTKSRPKMNILRRPADNLAIPKATKTPTSQSPESDKK